MKYALQDGPWTEFLFYEGEASAGGVGVGGDPDYPERRTGTPPKVCLRRSYPIKAKKSLSIQEVKEVREVRDDRAPCPLVLKM